MRQIDHPPLAPSLMDSMRSMGYSLGSALADLIDNSISAQARHVRIEFRSENPLHIAIIDDGVGMGGDRLIEAMRHGSRCPDDLLEDGDLGRFGLGLKTASLSQCRRMTVVSLCKGEQIHAYCWDLDIVKKEKRWVLLELDINESYSLPYVENLLTNGQGTMVLWENLDRLLAGEDDLLSAIGHRIDEARDHLSLIFHRYLIGEKGLRNLRIFINGTPLNGVDPFLSEHSLTQKLEDDEFRVEGKRIRIKPFILPHPSRLSPNEAKKAGGPEGLRSHQGFYIYRNKRLIIWGNWFRLAKKDELSRLARVRVDIPNSLDHLWTLDIRKSVANPPDVVRRQLRRTVEKIRERSRITHENRGHAERRGPIEHGWKRVYKAGSVRYDINREHPAIIAMFNELSFDVSKTFESILRVIEVSFPIESIYVDLASEQRVERLSNAKDVLGALAKDLISGLPIGSPARAALIANLHTIEPFSAHPVIARELSKELL